MKNIFIYGDSNIWGENFAGNRIKYHMRWVNRLKRSVAKDYKITSDGLCGRIAGNFREDKPEKNGQASFLKAYAKAGAAKIVIIALGTNDLQNKYSRSTNDIINDLIWYKEAANTSRVIFIIPPNFKTTDESGPEFTGETVKKLRALIDRKDELGETIEIGDLDLSDGLHFSELGHKVMANKVKQALERII